MLKFIKNMLPRQAAKTPEPAAECLHTETTDLGEGVRFCAECKTIQRLEKRKFIEPGEDAWFYRTLPKEEALVLLNDLKARKTIDSDPSSKQGPA